MSSARALCLVLLATSAGLGAVVSAQRGQPQGQRPVFRRGTPTISRATTIG